MKVEELRALARAVEPLPTDAGNAEGRVQVAAYNDLVFRFRQRITTALNNLSLFQVVDPELRQELRLLAKAMPGARSRAVAATRWESTDQSE